MKKWELVSDEELHIIRTALLDSSKVNPDGIQHELCSSLHVELVKESVRRIMAGGKNGTGKR